MWFYRLRSQELGDFDFRLAPGQPLCSLRLAVHPADQSCLCCLNLAPHRTVTGELIPQGRTWPRCFNSPEGVVLPRRLPSWRPRQEQRAPGEVRGLRQREEQAFRHGWPPAAQPCLSPQELFLGSPSSWHA